jgi:AraC-like DNA-binding protein
MDPLSDVLSLLRPRSYITAGLDAGGDWAIRFDDVAGRIKCYAVTSGACWLSVDGVEAPVSLSAGDCFVLASGRPFTLASDLSQPAVGPSDVFGDAGRAGGVATYKGGGGVFLTGSRFTVDGRHAALLLEALPPIIHLDAQADQETLRWAIERMMAELREPRPGAAMMAEHLSHMMLLQALRLHLARSPARSAGWFSALADPQISAAIGAMHADPARRWSLSDLAAEAGMSRTVFTQRFREKVGETPIAYLTRWRMMLAGDRLTRTDDALARTAQTLGYDSENAFNTAFKRVMGISPRRYARMEAPTAATV